MVNSCNNRFSCARRTQDIPTLLNDCSVIYVLVINRSQNHLVDVVAVLEVSRGEDSMK